MDTSGSTTQDAEIKKSPFDDLNRDELVVKCKSLLALAQKAKHAKLAFQNEIESYKLQLGKCESEKTNIQASLKTHQELVDSLTAHKLNMMTEVDSAKSKIKAFNNLCNTYEVEINKYKASLIIKDQNVSDANTKLSNLDSEVISLKRQKKRLEEENEQLINQLTEIEARTAEVNDIGLQQREQLQILEESVHSDEALQIKVDELRTKVKELENELEASKKTKIEESENFELKIKEITDLYESEKSKKEKANVKLKSYKDKILKCAACINQLKNSRYILTKTVKEYSENIPKWQNDIIKASKVLDDQVNLLSNENLFLKERVSILEAQIEELRKSLNVNSTITNTSVIDNNLQKGNNSLETKLSNLQDQFNEMLLSNNNLQQEITALKLANQQLHEVDMAAYINENKLLKEQFSDNIEKNYALTRANIEIMKSIEDLKTENEKLQESLQNKYQNGDNTETLNLQIKALESEKATLVKEKLTARDSVIELENHNKALTDLNIKLNVDIQSIKQELEIIANQNVLLQFRQQTGKDEENNMLKCTVMAQQEQFELLKKEYDNVQDLNNLLKEEVETLKLSLEQPKDDNLSDLNVSLQTDIVKLETKLAAYKTENSSLLSEIKESRNKIKEYDAKSAQYEENKSKLQNYKSENTELLNEMKEINQVLKERGESISKQQKAIAEMERLIDTLEKDRNKANEEKTVLLEKVECLEAELKNVETKTSMNNEVIKQIISDRDKAQSQLTENESIISALKEEIEKLKHHSSSHELPNEDMSTSTISKAEECSRMKDLDETFEEKYTKLRLFALKLKKKLNETLALLQNTQLDKAKLEKMLNENGHTDNKTAVKQGSDESMAGNNVSGGGDSSEVMELQAKLNSLTEASEKASAELEKQKAELQTKCNELAAEIDAHKATKDSLEKARRDVKKKSVLSLEMEDYERSLKELATKMEEKKKKMVQMESTIDTQEGTITAMRTQIKLLEEQIKAEETQNRLTKEELQHAIEDGKDKDNVIQAKIAVILKLEQDLEDEKRKNEEADLEMTTMISEKENIIMSLGEGKAELNNKVKRLEFKCSELNEKLKITVMELADLKTEYASYKVRAQAVLRQNQTVDHSQEEQLKEEAAALRAQIETFTSKLATLQEQCTEQSTEADNARRRASEAASEAARAQQRTARLHADLTRISQQLESERTQHKLQVSTLTQCYKTQMTEIEAKLVKETESLKKQLVGMQDSTKSGKAAVSDEAQHNQYMLPVILKDDSDGEMDINVSMIPREEGEGSESAPTPPLSKPYSSGAGASRRSPVPLERLLEEGVPEDEAFDTSSLDLTSDQEIADLKRRLMATQQRVKHVTVLLSESERECARMAQLSELLKSELRRVRGTTNNAHNTEYMKNVTLKFLTLPPGDERSRLVPVLQKILTLTVDETQKINAVAKGLDPNPGKGWGSYLTWSGSPK